MKRFSFARSSFAGTFAATLAIGAILGFLVGPTSAEAATAGAKLWVARYNGPGNAFDEGRDVGVSPDGTRVFVTGPSDAAPGLTDYATVAYRASSGAKVWARHYNGPTNENDVASALGVSPDGTRVFVTGASESTTGPDYATVAYDASSGHTLWVARYDAHGATDFATSLATSPDGTKVFVTGESRTGKETRLDYATVAYRASTGRMLWVARYNGTANAEDSAESISLSPDGNRVFVTGHSTGATSGLDYGTVAYDASTGVTLWSKRYNGAANSDDLANSLAVSPDGTRVFVTGVSDHSTGSDSATVAYDASTGATLWVKRYGGPEGISAGGFALGVSPDGATVFVTGTATGLTGAEYSTVAYDASRGTKLWVAPYAPNGGAASLAVSPDGTGVFVTGTSSEPTSGDDYATVAYGASTGAKLWARRYNGSANSDDEPWALALSPDGTAVFVTGVSIGSPCTPSNCSVNLEDFATVAYSAT